MFNSMSCAEGAAKAKKHKTLEQKLSPANGGQVTQILTSLQRRILQMDPSKKIVLLSNDGETFEIERAVAMESMTIKNMIEDGCAEGGIPLPNVSAKILAMVIEYCKRHAGVVVEEGEGSGSQNKSNKDSATSSGKDEDQLRNFDSNFVNVDHQTLINLVMAANYLNIKSLLNLTAQKMANDIANKTVEEVRTMFNIVNDFTPDEEAQIRAENAWAFK